jgi:hypothetical protein
MNRIQVVVLQLGYQYVMAAIIYKYIHSQRQSRQQQDPNQKSSTPYSSYLLGWGVIFPLSLYIPYYLVEMLDLRNHVLKLGAMAGMGVVSFGVVEAMYGTCPPVVESASLDQYIHYYSATVPYVWNAKTQSRTRITLQQLTRNIGMFAFNFTAFSVMLSFLMHFNFKPFSADPVQLEQYHFTKDLFRPSHLANAYLQAGKP